MKRWILITISVLIAATLVVIAMLRIFRPRNEVAGLVENALDLAIVAEYKSFEGPEADRLEESLDALARDRSEAADEASAILLGYYLGEHNAELQECAVTIRGPKVVPILNRYRQSPPKPWKLRYLSLRLPKESSKSMYDSAKDAIEHGKVLCE